MDKSFGTSEPDPKQAARQAGCPCKFTMQLLSADEQGNAEDRGSLLLRRLLADTITESLPLSKQGPLFPFKTQLEEEEMVALPFVNNYVEARAFTKGVEELGSILSA